MSIMQFMDRAAPFALDPAIALLGNEPAGAAFDFTTMRGFIRDPITAGSNWLGDPNDKLDYASPSTKWIWNKQGVLETGTALRCEYDPVTGEALGIRIESQRTNLFTGSNPTQVMTNTDQSMGLWVADAPSIVGNGSKQKLTRNNAANSGCYRYGGKNIYTIGTTYAFSFIVEKGDCLDRFVWCYLIGGPTEARANFDFTTGQMGAIGASVAAYSQALGGDRYRITYVFAATAANQPLIVGTGATQRTDVGASPSDNTVNGTGAIFDHMQVEAGNFASSPIPTTTAQVTRAADNISLATALFPYNVLSGVLTADFSSNDPANSPVAAVLRNAGTGSCPMRIRFSATNAQALVTDNNVVQAALNVTHGRDRTKAAGFYKANDFRFSADGSAVVKAGSGTVPADTVVLQFGALSGATASLDGWLRNARYIPRASITDEELQAWAA
jgi:hypothetical protein